MGRILTPSKVKLNSYIRYHDFIETTLTRSTCLIHYRKPLASSGGSGSGWGLGVVSKQRCVRSYCEFPPSLDPACCNFVL